MATTFVQIGTTITVGSGGAADAVFSSIPATFTDLKLVISVRSNQTDFAVTDVYVSFNDLYTNQTQRNLRGFGGTGSVTSQTRTDILLGNMPSAINTASTFANSEMYIPNYAEANNKSVSIDGVSESNRGETYDWWLNLGANLWSSTAAITSIKLIPSGGWNFVQNSTFTLYGIKST